MVFGSQSGTSPWLKPILLFAMVSASSSFFASAPRSSIGHSSTDNSAGTPSSNACRIAALAMSSNQEIEVTKSPGNKKKKDDKQRQPGLDTSMDFVPAPLHNVLDVNMETRGVVFECTLGRDLGIEIVEGGTGLKKGPVVGEVIPGSNAEALGIQVNDKIVATSATAGDNMWTCASLDGVKSALNTRFVMSSTVRVRFERALSSIPEDVLRHIKVPYYYNVQVKRPIGLHVTEGENDGGVYVDDMKPDLGAARTRRIEIGDQVLAMSASWGDRMWDVSSIDSFVVGVKMRTDQQLSFRLKRMVSFDTLSGRSARKHQRDSVQSPEKQRETRSDSISSVRSQWSPSAVSIANAASSSGFSSSERPKGESFIDSISRCSDGDDILRRWNALRDGDTLVAGSGYASAFTANKAMSRALVIERPDVAVRLFEDHFGFYVESDPARDLLDAMNTDETVLSGEESHAFVGQSNVLGNIDGGTTSGDALEPNNFVCTTAIKAYGRQGRPDKALNVLRWSEENCVDEPDIFMMTALLYVCAKAKRCVEAEDIFWNEIPRRGLEYTVATTNSLMYMYAKLNRPDDALRVYELTKSLGLTCTVVTYGVLIKALVSSGKKPLEQSAYDILQSLPSMDITPTIEIYNQFFEHYAHTHNYRQTKQVLKLMSNSRPKVKPDVVSYGFLISCFAASKKPRSALKVFYQMRRRGIAPSSYCYMGVLKALAHMRDCVSAGQVLTEMEEVGVKPGKKHFSMAMFAAIISGQPELAQTMFSRYKGLYPNDPPDTALCTLLLRSLLQQNRWDDATALINKMSEGPTSARPNLQTFNYLLKYQIGDDRFVQAKVTLKKALAIASARSKSTRDVREASSSNGKVNISGGGPAAMRGVYNSLAMALGTYSSHMQHMTKEDQQYSVVYFSDVLGDETVSLEGSAIPAASTQSSPVKLKKPTEEGFAFLCDALETIVASGSTVQGDFYQELLKALALEGYLPEANRVLKCGRSGLLRSSFEDGVKIAASEDLVMRLLEQKQDSKT